MTIIKTIETLLAACGEYDDDNAHALETIAAHFAANWDSELSADLLEPWSAEGRGMFDDGVELVLYLEDHRTSTLRVVEVDDDDFPARPSGWRGVQVTIFGPDGGSYGRAIADLED